INMELIRKNPAKKVELPKFKKKDISPLTDVQVKTLLSTAQDDPYYALYHVALDTGAREGELFALEWDDFDPSAGVLTISKSLEETKGRLRVKEPKTPSSRRRVRLGPGAVTALVDHRERQRREEVDCRLIFPSPEGSYLRRPNLARRFWKPLLQRAKLP